MENNFRKQNYDNFLEKIIKKIEMESVKKDLKKMQDIDLNHYSKIITIENIKEYIEYFKNKEIETVDVKNVLILTFGNPEIVFKSCIEAVRKNVNMEIVIQDFCLAQNTFIIEIINNVLESLKMKNKISIKNNLKDTEIINLSKSFDKVISIGDSNTFNRLSDEIEIKLYPYGIFEMYSDSEEFEELKEKIYELLEQNQFEVEEFDDVYKEEVVKIINRTGYKFCNLVLTKDKNVQEDFKNNSEAQYVMINKNPFKEMIFELKL